MLQLQERLDDAIRSSSILGAWKEGTIRSCSYTRKNPHRRQRQEVLCIQNGWREGENYVFGMIRHPCLRLNSTRIDHDFEQVL